MRHEELLDRISIDPEVCGGKPCIRGHRIWVSLILDFMASGMTQEAVLEEYPQLTADDIRACVAYKGRGGPWLRGDAGRPGGSGTSS